MTNPKHSPKHSLSKYTKNSKHSKKCSGKKVRNNRISKKISGKKDKRLSKSNSKCKNKK